MGICVGSSTVVTESSIFVSSVLSISIPGGCNSLGLVVGDSDIDDASNVLIVVDVVDIVDVVDTVEVVVSVTVTDSVVVSSVVVIVSVVVVGSSVVVVVSVVVGLVVDTVVGLVIGSVDATTDCVEVASRIFCSIVSESISK